MNSPTCDIPSCKSIHIFHLSLLTSSFFYCCPLQTKKESASSDRHIGGSSNGSDSPVINITFVFYINNYKGTGVENDSRKLKIKNEGSAFVTKRSLRY